MDWYLFGEYIFEPDEDMLDKISKFIVTKAQDKVEAGNKGYYNYYPQEKRGIQLIVETIQEDHTMTMFDTYFHHTSGDIWTLKIIQPMKEFKNTYMVSREDGKGLVVIRLVNEEVLGNKLGKDDIIEVQVSAFAINGGIWQDEDDYDKSVAPDEDGKRLMLADGALMPINLLVNNSAYLSDEELKAKDHYKDNLLSFKGTIDLANSYDLNIFESDFPKYYQAIINTEYGQLSIFFTQDYLNEEMKSFGRGNIISGELFLSGDVCINEYDKYIRGNDLRIGQDEE